MLLLVIIMKATMFKETIHKDFLLTEPYQVVETGFGGLIGPKGTRPKSVFVSGSLYTANGPLTIEGKNSNTFLIHFI